MIIINNDSIHKHYYEFDLDHHQHQHNNNNNNNNNNNHHHHHHLTPLDLHIISSRFPHKVFTVSKCPRLKSWPKNKKTHYNETCLKAMPPLGHLLMMNQCMEVWSQLWFQNVSNTMALNQSFIIHYHKYVQSVLRRNHICTTFQEPGLSSFSAGASLNFQLLDLPINRFISLGKKSLKRANGMSNILDSPTLSSRL